MQPAPIDTTPAAANDFDSKRSAQDASHVIKSRHDNRLDLIYRVFIKKSDANIEKVKDKLRQSTHFEEANIAMDEYCDNMISIADEMCQELRDCGYTEYDIGTARSNLYLYMNDTAHGLSELFPDLTP